MNRVIRALKRLNDALPDLIAGILIYGLVVLCAGLFLSRNRLLFFTGLCTGIGLAIFLAVHIAIVLNDAVFLHDSSQRILALKSVFRYLVVVVVFFVMTYFKLGDFIAAFIGIMGLKVSAYVQQFRRKG